VTQVERREPPLDAWHDNAPLRAATLSSLTLVALLSAVSAHAHGLGSHTGFVSTVSTIEPHVPGLLVRVLGGHEQLSLSNLTRQNVVIFDPNGRALQRIPAGTTRVWADPRIGSDEAPPEREGLVRYWRIAGTAGGKRFEIVGFLGYRPPPGEEAGDSETPRWTVVVAVVGAVLLLGAAIALLRLARN
jgi:hypothetical protein